MNPLKLQRTYVSLWTMAVPSANRPLVEFLRVRVITILVTMCVFPLSLAAFVSAYLLHRPNFVGAGLVFVAVGLANNAVLEAFRVRYASQLRRWTGWKQEPIWRHEQPVRYWSRTAAHVTFVAVSSAGAAFLIWTGLGLLAKP